MRADELLHAAAELFTEKNQVYSDGYRRFGLIMEQIFVEGIKLETADEFARFGIMVHIINKIVRYCNTFHTVGPSDSLRDLTVYSAMLQELDLDIVAEEDEKDE